MCACSVCSPRSLSPSLPSLSSSISRDAGWGGENRADDVAVCETPRLGSSLAPDPASEKKTKYFVGVYYFSTPVPDVTLCGSESSEE